MSCQFRHAILAAAAAVFVVSTAHAVESQAVGAAADEYLQVAGWKDKFKKKSGGTQQQTPDGKKDLPAGDCTAYPIGCGPGYTDPKLRGIDCQGRSQIGCLCWKGLGSKEQCDAYYESKKKGGKKKFKKK